MSFLAGQGDQQLPGRCKPPSRRKFNPKAKTGCHTCRIRRVKCDEGRPACNRCLSTGRVCDGYPSVFRVFTLGASPSSTSAPAATSKPSLSLYQPMSSIVTADEVNKLAQYFHRNRRASVCYQNEARAILANLSDPAIRHALNSLSALHDGLEERRYTAIIDGRSPFVNERSLDAYNAAVSSLASRLREEPSRTSAQTTLVCCQMFVSIEVMMGDYRTAFQHFLLGLRIMYQYQSRPGVSDSGLVVPCLNPGFPHLDAFAIKLFASGYPGPRHLSTCQRAYRGPMAIAAKTLLCYQARSDLSALSVQVLEFLSRLTDLRSHSQVAELKMKRAGILGCLQSWEQMYFKTVQEIMRGTSAIRVRFGTAFCLLLYRVLKVVVNLAMNVSPDDVEGLERDFCVLTEIASFATEIRSII
ncbi:hypothetical protein EDB81DRAFT_840216 [Dactylonectria macrodidyma]|uniref:Zn(2)-C6 fungal-type domain-containing protein n=1 Tax=Dactylonectria macrodidyma TaxID=307937 RepID=A0A9P9F9Y3_9HYPO|nr:hypothetical protein EDB81DRAFT_840216 [Dactylonectria macrodidyma]